VFDYRYHALSLAGVFLALGVGLLLGVVIGDEELVSSAKEDVRDSLRGDVREARAQADELRAELRLRNRYETQSYPAVVGGRLDGRRIGLLALGDLSDAMVGHVRSALQGSGARLESVGEVAQPLDLDDLAERAEGTRYERLGEDDRLVRALGVRLGVQYVRGGRLLRRMRQTLLRSSSGRFDGVEGVVLVRDPGDLEDAERDAMDAFEDGLVTGLTRIDIPVVGVESTAADPSQVPWFQRQDLASVDAVDDRAGKAALVFALAGADGTFGLKGTADTLLPPVPGNGP